MKRITFISDTHNKHKQITSHLPGGDILIHAGDISSMGYPREIKDFCKWFNGIEGYTNKIFIAGNHDWGFINHIDKVNDILEKYDGQQSNYIILFVFLKKSLLDDIESGKNHFKSPLYSRDLSKGLYKES
jgi:3',5'-cyclic AMP phosphodiesterase CpdA